MPEPVMHVHCSQCGKRVSGIDPDLGLVVRAFVECPECIGGASFERCINCGGALGSNSDDATYHGEVEGGAFVGPLCHECNGILRESFRDLLPVPR